MNKGKIVQVIGPVVDVEFPDPLPAIYNAVAVEFDVPGQGRAYCGARARCTCASRPSASDESTHGIAIERRQPSVGYRETTPCKANQPPKQQSGGHGQYGDVVLDIKPIAIR